VLSSCEKYKVSEHAAHKNVALEKENESISHGRGTGMMWKRENEAFSGRFWLD
jgi:hypothetical protein